MATEITHTLEVYTDCMTKGGNAEWVLESFAWDNNIAWIRQLASKYNYWRIIRTSDHVVIAQSKTQPLSEIRITEGESEQGIGSTSYTPIYFNGILIAHKLKNRVDATGYANRVSYTYNHKAPHSRNNHYSWLRWFYEGYLSGWWDSRNSDDVRRAIRNAAEHGLPIVPFEELTDKQKAIVEAQEQSRKATIAFRQRG